HPLQQHVERVGWPTLDSQNLASGRLDCVSVRRQEPELVLLATGEELDVLEHLELWASLPPEMEQVNQRMPTLSRGRVKLVDQARFPPQSRGPVTRSIHTRELRNSAGACHRGKYGDRYALSYAFLLPGRRRCKAETNSGEASRASGGLRSTR